MIKENIKGISKKSFNLIIEILKNYPEITEALVFGSRAVGTYKKGSNIDIALKGKIDNNKVLEISAQLNEQQPIPHKIDVINYRTISNADLKSHIDTFGIIFYGKQDILSKKNCLFPVLL